MPPDSVIACSGTTTSCQVRTGLRCPIEIDLPCSDFGEARNLTFSFCLVGVDNIASGLIGNDVSCRELRFRRTNKPQKNGSNQKSSHNAPHVILNRAHSISVPW